LQFALLESALPALAKVAVVFLTATALSLGLSILISRILRAAPLTGGPLATALSPRKITWS
jgi:hypothetical protein